MGLFKKFGTLKEASMEMYRTNTILFLANLINNRSVLVARDRKKYGYSANNEMTIFLVFVDINLHAASLVFRLYDEQEVYFKIVSIIEVYLTKYGIDTDRVCKYHDHLVKNYHILKKLVKESSDDELDYIISNVQSTLISKMSFLDISQIIVEYIMFFGKIAEAP